MKDKPIKIRRTWTRHPSERIKEDKDKRDYCQLCGAYKTDPEACILCEKDNEVEEYYDNQVGGA